ncbi:hypothetical protein [Campylobacter lari]|uniref:hypothetical protein n=1 Tax=Campylobacter lari TaxID=201 RepID=UPI002149A1D5|nr:hypothetical protein [Campylobacter lari]MCR2075840.1 hypothetical protein [Campylobacter lari subsp. concheus]MCR2083875.1 hypothetical protein [Campylobacter lari subsp. concheus]MCR2085500.1 hypothetical protein [Campylobacter lari subsp. concheus]HDV6578182.1 hypothetical protein [Campylobacter lari]
MGFRGHIFKKYDVEYGSEFFNHGFDECISLLQELNEDLIFYKDEDNCSLELSTKELLKIDTSLVKHEELREFLEKSIEVANTADYSKKHGYVRVEWF